MTVERRTEVQQHTPPAAQEVLPPGTQPTARAAAAFIAAGGPNPANRVDIPANIVPAPDARLTVNVPATLGAQVAGVNTRVNLTPAPLVAGVNARVNLTPAQQPAIAGVNAHVNLAPGQPAIAGVNAPVNFRNDPRVNQLPEHRRTPFTFGTISSYGDGMQMHLSLDEQAEWNAGHWLIESHLHRAYGIENTINLVMNLQAGSFTYQDEAGRTIRHVFRGPDKMVNGQLERGSLDSPGGLFDRLRGAAGGDPEQARIDINRLLSHIARFTDTRYCPVHQTTPGRKGNNNGYEPFRNPSHPVIDQLPKNARDMVTQLENGQPVEAGLVDRLINRACGAEPAHKKDALKLISTAEAFLQVTRSGVVETSEACRVAYTRLSDAEKNTNEGRALLGKLMNLRVLQRKLDQIDPLAIYIGLAFRPAVAHSSKEDYMARAEEARDFVCDLLQEKQTHYYKTVEGLDHQKPLRPDQIKHYATQIAATVLRPYSEQGTDPVTGAARREMVMDQGHDALSNQWTREFCARHGLHTPHWSLEEEFFINQVTNFVKFPQTAQIVDTFEREFAAFYGFTAGGQPDFWTTTTQVVTVVGQPATPQVATALAQPAADVTATATTIHTSLRAKFDAAIASANTVMGEIDQALTAAPTATEANPHPYGRVLQGTTLIASTDYPAAIERGVQAGRMTKFKRFFSPGKSNSVEGLEPAEG